MFPQRHYHVEWQANEESFEPWSLEGAGLVKRVKILYKKGMQLEGVLVLVERSMH